MGAAKRNLIGEVFGKLTVLEEAAPYLSPRGDKKRQWLCRCICGNNVVTSTSSLTGGNTKSCGCYRSMRASDSQKTHGLSKTPEYQIWDQMKMRCYNVHNKNYGSYGGRGIIVCDEWKESFKTFYSDMGPRPDNNYSLDRIDVDGNYEPSNCRWVTRSLQSFNTRIYKNNTSGKQGVFWRESLSKWEAGITINHENIYLGRFVSYDDACSARAEAELKYFGFIKE